MKSKKIILENIRKEELNKINLHCFHFLKKDSSENLIFSNSKSSSSFYNTSDLHKKEFYKNISLLTPKEFYDKL